MMLKKILFVGAMAMATVSVQACELNISSGNPEVFQVMKKYGLSPNNYDQVCIALKNHNAGLEVVADSSKFSNVIVAHATIMIKDMQKPVYTSSYSHTTTRINRDLEGDPGYLMYQTIISTLEHLNMAKMTQALKEARMQNK